MLQDGPLKRSSTETGPDPGDGASKVRALIVDDDADAAHTLSMLLATEGIITHSTTDSRTALEVFVDFRPHAVILDLDMPGLDGFELCRSIRAFPFAEAVLIAIVSGYDHSDYKVKAIDSGANYYFVKPAEPIKVVELIKSAKSDTRST